MINNISCVFICCPCSSHCNITSNIPSTDLSNTSSIKVKFALIREASKSITLQCRNFNISISSIKLHINSYSLICITEHTVTSIKSKFIFSSHPWCHHYNISSRHCELFSFCKFCTIICPNIKFIAFFNKCIVRKFYCCLKFNRLRTNFTTVTYSFIIR